MEFPTLIVKHFYCWHIPDGNTTFNYLGVTGKLTSHPQNIVTQRGQAVTFSCGSDEVEFVNWKYKSTSSLTDVRISTGGMVINGLKKKFELTRVGQYNILKLKSASLSDGGTYTCIDNAGFGDEATAELVVLGLLYIISIYCYQIVKNIKIFL